jgi:hypothetical protein
MDYFGGTTGIGTLCCLGLLWAIDLVGKPLWHPTTHISCYMDLNLYSRVIFGEKLALIVDLDDPNIWVEYLQERDQFFQRAMPMAMENLSIAQHRDTLRYARIRSGA